MMQKNSPLRFALVFVGLFLFFYYFNILFFRATLPGKHYIAFLALHLDYIRQLRCLLLYGTAGLLKLFGFSAVFNDYELLVAGHGSIRVVYSCLGLGILSFLAAFILAYPKSARSKIAAMIIGIMVTEFLNIVRFMLLALYGTTGRVDHHTIYTAIMYVIISGGLYFWIRNDMTYKKYETDQPGIVQ
jgi:exosortase/archaeosortase family protein